MFIRIACIAALAIGPATTPAFFAEPMPQPSAAASAHCPEMASIPIDKLPAKAWAAVAFPSDQLQALQAKAGAAFTAKTPSVRVLRTDLQGSHVVGVVAEKSGNAWVLHVVEDQGGAAKARTLKLGAERASRLDRILADACFWAEPTDLSPEDISAETAQAACVDASDLQLEAVTDRGRRAAVQHCSPRGLTGSVADIFWNAADIN